MTPELPEAFNFTSILYTLNTHLRPNFTPFHSMTKRFRDTKLPKIENALINLRMTLTT